MTEVALTLLDLNSSRPLAPASQACELPCSSNSELQPAAFEPALKYPILLGPANHCSPASNTHYPEKKRPGLIPLPAKSLHCTVSLMPPNSLRRSYTRRVQMEVLSYLQQESEPVPRKVLGNGAGARHMKKPKSFLVEAR